MMRQLRRQLFRSIQSLYYTESPSDEWQLIAAVQRVYDTYSVEKLNKMLLTHEICMNEILKDNSGNNYNIPHMNKDALMRGNWLLLKIKVTEEAKKFDWTDKTNKITQNNNLSRQKSFHRHTIYVKT